MDIYQLDYILHEPRERRLDVLGGGPGPAGLHGLGKDPSGDPALWTWPACRAPQGERRTPSQGADFTQQRQGQPDVNRLTYGELRRKLESLGGTFQRQGRGSHEMWLNPTNGRRTPIPRHVDHDLATGTLHRIRRNLGISKSDFDQA